MVDRNRRTHPQAAGRRKRLGDLTQEAGTSGGKRISFAWLRTWFGAIAAAMVASAVLAGPAAAETRSLKIHFVHTGEKGEVVYKRNGRYDRDGLSKLNRLVRDFRRNEPTKMDPRLFDLLWSIYRQTGSREYITVLSGYRSPATNAYLRRTRGGQAEKSQHIQGKAIDFYIPGVSLKKLREIAMKQQGGGVGYYPRSGSPFVHVDVARVRAWPRMSRQELVRLFPDGKTLHVPPDGKPLPGYQAALAAYNSRQKSGELAIVSSGSAKKPTAVLAALFGNEDDGEGEDMAAAPAPKPAAKAAPKAAAFPDTPDVPDQSGRGTIVASLPDAAPAEPLDTPRPAADVGALAADGALPKRAPVPARRPDNGLGEVALAALGETEGVATDVPFPTGRPDAGGTEVASLEPAPAGKAARVAMTDVATQKGGRVIGAEAAPVPLPKPKATPTTAKPTALDAEPAPMPVVRPVDDQEVKVALAEPKPEIIPNRARTETFAAKAVEKPAAVFMAGFSRESGAVDVNRFTGKAVEFLRIAKFKKP